MKRWLRERGWRFWTQFAACALMALCLARPTVPWPRSVYRYLFVIDITQSMNARDYHVEGLPADRLNYVKAALRTILRDLPCGSEAGLGLYTTQNSQILFEPVEICARLGLIDSVVERIDWRMAWAGNSHIAQGLYSALRKLAESDPNARLVFFTDGQQFPPQEPMPPFHGKPGEVRGLIVGVGGPQAVPIPRYDRENHPRGYWQNVDVEDWLPAVELAGRPKHASENYFTRLDEIALKTLANVTGLNYHRLTTPAALAKALRGQDLAERRTVKLDPRPMLALLAMLLLSMPGLVERLPGRSRA